MKSKKELLKESRLHVIIDKDICGRRSLLEIADKIKNSGADIIQLRDKHTPKTSILKTALALRKLLSKYRLIFIINDYLDIAKIANCDGVHLGQLDSSAESARRILGKNKIIGVTCHNLKQAIDAQKMGADYIGIGPVFVTSTKPQNRNTISVDLLKKIKQDIKIPFFAVGGINKENIRQLSLNGVKRVAICSAICKAKNVAIETKKLSSMLN